jgi:hypothetical protein
MRSGFNRRTMWCGGLLGVLLILTACGHTITDVLAPSSMKVSVDVKDYHMGTSQVAMHFADAQDNTVEFIHGETVTCNGVFLKYDSNFFAQLIGYGAYTGETPLQSATGAYTFTFKPASGAAISLKVPVVNAPMRFRDPVQGAQVPIPTATAPLSVQYNISGIPNTSIAAVASDSRAHVAVAGSFTESGSVAFNSNDFKNFAPGPGNITLSRITHQSLGGTSFISADTYYENLTTIQITWQ